MGSIVMFDPAAEKSGVRKSKIDVSLVRERRRRLKEGLIQPPEEVVEQVVAEDHTADPIKNVDDIMRISQYLVDNELYRDNMLFIVGINFGLRVSDLLRLRFSDLIGNDYVFKKTFPILEKKTMNTRKVKKNRYITINDAVIDAVLLYLEHNECRLDFFMFRSESNNGSNINRAMDRTAVNRVLKKAADAVGVDAKVSSHTLRKTFGYHQMVMANHDPRRLLLLQKIFGHSSSAQTMDYIGITSEEIESAYLGLNLGLKTTYASFNQLSETDAG